LGLTNSAGWGINWSGVTWLNGTPGSAPFGSTRYHQLFATSNSTVIGWTPPQTGAPLAITNGGTGAESASAARTALGLGTLATQNGTFSGTSSGNNTGDQDLSGYAAKAGNETISGNWKEIIQIKVIRQVSIQDWNFTQVPDGHD
jgi:hypothetical protein